MYVKKLIFSSLIFIFIITEFSTAASESIGKYNAGCIKNSAELKETGEGYQVIRTGRKRHYASTSMVSFIKNLSKKLNEKYNTNILIADISKNGGGPMLDDHSSHQTGLDADILYLDKIKFSELFTVSEREQLEPVSKINNSKNEIDLKKWTPLNGELLKAAAGYSEVDRIFVNPAVKKHLCNTYKNEGWLKKLRPWWGHEGHFHVRLNCPEDSSNCVGIETPSQIECGSELDWWFSDEAYEQLKQKRSETITEKDIVLPEECL